MKKYRTNIKYTIKRHQAIKASQKVLKLQYDKPKIYQL